MGQPLFGGRLDCLGVLYSEVEHCRSVGNFSHDVGVNHVHNPTRQAATPAL